MYKIVKKQVLNENVKLFVIEAPFIAKKAEPGQFIMLRIDETGERIPLTISDYDAKAGTVTIVFQEVGKTTVQLGALNEGDTILDFAGPLGQPTHYPEGTKKAVVIGGGLGTAIAYPSAKKLHQNGIEVSSIIGFKNKDYIIYEDEMKKISHKLIVTTDDGSNGTKGFVTQQLEQLIESGDKFDLCIAIGPLIMMKFVCEITKKYGIHTLVSLNPIMIDGTGMCGGCRVLIDGKTKFACVDGPDFDGHLVDFDDCIKRQGFYRSEEANSLHICKLTVE